MTVPDTSGVEAYCETWSGSLAVLLASLSCAGWKAQPATDAGEYPPRFRVCVSGGSEWRGRQWISFSPGDAAALFRVLQREDSNETTPASEPEQTSTLVDLVQQWADFAANALESDFGKPSLRANAEDGPVTRSPMSRLLHVTDGTVSISALLELDESLERRLSRGEPTVIQPSPAMARSRIEELVREGNLGLLLDVELEVRLHFGCRQATLREVLELTNGAVLELDREIQEPVDLLLNGRVVARGEVVVVDGNYGLRVTEVSSAQQRVSSL